jgi:23S rRNA (cytidine1920-2'-O)/16S rRNA (cytidine1409-2'-O)-methyltransferase
VQQKRERLDKILVERKLVSGRSMAREIILAGAVLVDGFPVKKPASLVRKDCSIDVTGNRQQWVSRGARKLLGALESFHVSVEGRVCIDIGASTGGFTDVLLQKGAEKVYAVDVGYGQLAWKLRKDPRVVVMERTNARELSFESFEAPSLVTIDVSFISLRHILPVADGILQNDGLCIALVKPQFEAGRGRIGKKGVVRDKSVHEEVLRGLCDFVREETGFFIAGVDVSSLMGPEGNREFFLCLVKAGDVSGDPPHILDDTEVEKMIVQKVEASHSPVFFESETEEDDGGRRI